MDIKVDVGNNARRARVSWWFTEEEKKSFVQRETIPVVVLCSARFSGTKIKRLGMEFLRRVLTQDDAKIVLASESSSGISFFDPGEGFLFWALVRVSDKSELSSLQALLNEGLLRPNVTWGPSSDGGLSSGWPRSVFKMSNLGDDYFGYMSVMVPQEACFIPMDDQFVRWVIGGRSKNVIHHWGRRFVAYPIGVIKGLIVGLWQSFWWIVLVAILGLIVCSFYIQPMLAFIALIVGLVTGTCSITVAYHSGKIIKSFDAWQAKRKEARHKKWLEGEYKRLSVPPPTTKD